MISFTSCQLRAPESFSEIKTLECKSHGQSHRAQSRRQFSHCLPVSVSEGTLCLASFSSLCLYCSMQRSQFQPWPYVATRLSSFCVLKLTLPFVEVCYLLPPTHCSQARMSPHPYHSGFQKSFNIYHVPIPFLCYNYNIEF